MRALWEIDPLPWALHQEAQLDLQPFKGVQCIDSAWHSTQYHTEMDLALGTVHGQNLPYQTKTMGS